MQKIVHPIIQYSHLFIYFLFKKKILRRGIDYLKYYIYNIFTINYKWQIARLLQVFNLNPLLKLFFYSQITQQVTSNNLQLKICSENNIFHKL